LPLSSSSSHYYYYQVIITWQAPLEKPSIFAQEDGQGFSCIMYFTITDETVAMVNSHPDKMTPGLKLFLEFYK